MRFIKSMVLGLGLFALPLSLQAQSTSPDSIVQVTAENQGLPLVAREDLPLTGTFWLISANGSTVPLPCAPPDQSLPIYAVSDQVFLVDGTGGLTAVSPHRAGYGTVADVLAVQANAVVNLVNQAQATQVRQTMLRSSGLMSLGNLPGFDETGSGTDTNTYVTYNLDTNQLWLEITNVANGWSYLNLHSGTNTFATNQVFAIWGTSDLLSDWQVETELWPTGDQTNVLPFAVQNFDRQNLFLKAQDWTAVDSNSDGVPDWWIWKYFGDFSVTATNLDSQGRTLGDDYTNGVDPNVIRFTIQRGNYYLNTTNVNLQLNLTAGTPNQYAARVNAATGTNWQSFVSTNLTVYLGSTDGVYQVSIGLKGWPVDATQTWQTVTFIRDTTPLTLGITNLPALSGSRRFIDPAGVADKALSSVRYTVVTADGVTNTGYGIFTDTELNPTNPYQVRNWVKWVDLALALGTNQVSLSAVDWAGNLAVTNFAYVYDTNNDQTPPAISLITPQSGDTLSGESFTLQAWLDDDTATAELQYTDTNATVHTIPGLVERGGNLWFASVPLVPGTNDLSITAVDAAGNPSTTNIQVFQSGVTLTITPLSSEELNHAYATVTGTVSDTQAVITVNGVAGTNYGNGSWSVPNVPLPPGGTVPLLAVAQPAGQPPVQNLSAAERDSVVFTEKYTYALDYDWEVIYPDATNRLVDHMDVHWARGAGGTNTLWFTTENLQTGEVWSNVTVTVWPPDPGYGPTLVGVETSRGYTNGVLVSQSTLANVAPPSVEWMETSASTGTWSENFAVSWTESSGREVRLFTGGKALRQRQSLFALSATLIETEWVDGNIPDWSFWYQIGGFLWPDNPAVTVPSVQIALGAEGNLGADGNLWTVQKDDEEVVITPTAPPANFRGYLPGQQKYKSYFEVFVRQPFPRFPDDYNDYGPDGPPFGYPVYQIGGKLAGHAWWKLSCDAPVEAINLFTTTNYSQWLNREVGYGPVDNSFDYWACLINATAVKVGPGYLSTNNGSADVHRIYKIGFQSKGLIDALGHTESVHQSPGEWDSLWHNCVHESVITGKTAGIQLPYNLNDSTPEEFGRHLPPSD